MTTDTQVLIRKHETERSTYHETGYDRIYLDVTDRARELFGDIVVSAMQVASEIREYDRSFDDVRYYTFDSVDRLRIDYLRYFEYDTQSATLQVNAGNAVYILFTSGKTVCFHSSEWGGICTARKNRATR